MEKNHQQEEINFIIENNYGEQRNEFDSSRKQFVFQPIKTQQKQQYSSIAAFTRSKAMRTRSHSVESSIANSDSTGNSDEELSSGSGSSGSGSPPRQPSPTTSEKSNPGSAGSSGNDSDEDFPSLFHPSQVVTYAPNSYPIRDDLARPPLRSQRWIRDHHDLKKISTQYKSKKQDIDVQSEVEPNIQPMNVENEPKSLTQDQLNIKAQLKVVGGGKAPLKGARKLWVPYALDSYPDATNLRRKPLYHDQVVIKEKKENNFAFKYIPVYQEGEERRGELKVSTKQLHDHKNLHVIQSNVTNKAEGATPPSFKYIPITQVAVKKSRKETSKNIKKAIKDHKNLQLIQTRKVSMKSASSQKKVTFNYIPVYQELKENSQENVQTLSPQRDELTRRPLHSGASSFKYIPVYNAK